MRRLGSFFQRYNSNSNPSPVSSRSSNTHQLQHAQPMFGRISEDNDAKRRAVSADGYSEHANRLRALAGYSRTSYRANSTVEDSSVEDYVKRVKKTAMYLKLILHSRKCQGRCRLPSCQHTCRVLKHVLQCHDERCHATGCQTTKKLLIHYEQCPTKSAAMAAAQAKEPPQSRSFSGADRECCEAQMLADNESASTPPGRHSFGNRIGTSDDSFESCSDSPNSTCNVPHSTFCLLCSFVASGTTEDALHQQQRTASNETMMNGSAMQVDDCHEFDEDTNSLLVFDEVINFSKVPFQNTHEQFSQHSCGCSRPFPLAPLPEVNEDLEEEPRRKVRSKSLDSMHGMQI